MSLLARRSISPTAISDVSDASPTGSPNTVYGRLVNAVPHVHYNLDTNTIASRKGSVIQSDQEYGPIAAEVRRLLVAPRSRAGGLNGRLTFNDLDSLLSHFRVDVFGADTVDDIWVTMCEVCGFKLAPAFLSDVTAIASVIEQFGGKAPEVKRIPPRERSMSPTVSSARKAVAHVQHDRRQLTPSNRPQDVRVFQRLTKDAAESRRRRDDVRRAGAQERDERAVAECTFTPRLGKVARGGSAGRVHSFDGPTQSSLSRVAPKAAAAEVDDYVDVGMQLRRSLPSQVPSQVPIGYVEAVSRLRQGAADRANTRQTFEESLRAPQHVSARRADHLATGTILRISVPSLGEIVHVRLASPRRH